MSHNIRRVLFLIYPKVRFHNIYTLIYCSLVLTAVGVLSTNASKGIPRNLDSLHFGVTLVSRGGLENSRYRSWKEKGFSAIKYIFDPGGLIYSFDQLKNKYSIPNRDFFMYLQSRHFVQSMTSCLGDESTKNGLSETMKWIKVRPFKTRFLYPALIDLLKAWKLSL